MTLLRTRFTKVMTVMTKNSELLFFLFSFKKSQQFKKKE